ncbi:hypothetical protein DHEL01_v206102 [Diaporthe helianthi]|uniref:Xylanolytic transcriptional activator regulatory domain-containing protein n=1 Tax=Diaporthe helianthi TaxID=158607 RepID=A0A2P5HZ24_DIAHE|nr:hypothetical protein DHEL01_v206102 [Diaporthe helianthi]
MNGKREAPTPIQSIVAGAAAGGVESLVTYPTEYAKTRRQLLQFSRSTLTIVAEACRAQGVKALYSGAGVFCASNAAKSGIRFLTFDLVKDRLPRDPQTGKHTATSSMLAGVAAGVAESVTVVTPGENLKTKMVEDRTGARQFNSAAAVVRGIVAKDGPAGLFRGVVPVTMKQGSNALVRFTSYHALLDSIQPILERGGWGTFAPAVAGAGAGVVTVYATMPFDVVKTKMQSLGAREQYGGTWRCVLAVARQSGVGGFWTGTAPRLVRLSCDGSVPACSNCAKAGEVCFDVDGQNAELLIPRNFGNAARARIEWLEQIIRDRLPDVDLNHGPQVNMRSDQPLPTHVGHQAGVSPTRPADAASSSNFQQPRESGLLKRTADVSNMSDHDESFPEKAHSVAVDLGMLSLNADSSQNHYLGSSSGLLFANLIGASPRSAESSSVRDTGSRSFTLEDEPLLEPAHRSYALHYRALHQFLRQSLPKKDEALLLVHYYIRCTHPDYPVLEPDSLLQGLDALYDCASSTLPEDDGFRSGWPRSSKDFRWNGCRFDPQQPCAVSVPMPVLAFIIFMVLNIAAIVRVRARVHTLSPETFYAAALHFSQDCFSHISLSTIQALTVLLVHCLLIPAEANIWTLTHIAMAHCVELGVHRDQPPGAHFGWDHQQLRRSIFHTIYSLDRCISSIQGRPLGLRDETFDVRLPEVRQIDPTDDRMTLGSFQMSVLTYSSYRFRLDRIISDIKEHLYYLPSKTLQNSVSVSPDSHQTRIRTKLDTWWEQTALGLGAITSSGVGARQKTIWRLKLEIRYNQALVLLYQPSQEIRHPSQDHLLQCYGSASSILDNYQLLYENKGLYHGWFTVQNIFAAGATLVYSFWTSPAVRRDADGVQLLRRLRTCSNLLSAGGEWWPSARKGLDSFGSVVDLTIQRLYNGDGGVSKQRRLTARGDPVSPRVSSLHDGTAQGDAVHAAHYEPPSSSTMANFSQPWAQPYDFHQDTGPGSWASTSEYLENDSRRQLSAIPDESPQVASAPGLFPEIEDFLADFNRSEFSWSFPLSAPQESPSIGDAWAAVL